MMIKTGTSRFQRSVFALAVAIVAMWSGSGWASAATLGDPLVAGDFEADCGTDHCIVANLPHAGHMNAARRSGTITKWRVLDAHADLRLVVLRPTRVTPPGQSYPSYEIVGRSRWQRVAADGVRTFATSLHIAKGAIAGLEMRNGGWLRETTSNDVGLAVRYLHWSGNTLTSAQFTDDGIIDYNATVSYR